MNAAFPIAFLFTGGCALAASMFAMQDQPIVHVAKGSSLRLSGHVPGPSLRVSGRQLLDPCGEPIVIRGVEDNVHSDVAEIAKSGANAIRFVYAMKPAELEARIKSAVEHKMLVSFISPNGYRDTGWWNRPEIKAILVKYQQWLLPHAYGEGAYSKNNARWLRETKKVITDLRGFGYKFPIEILADQWGQSLSTLLDHGAELVAFDPEHNILLGNQMYSEYHPDEATMGRIVASGLPIMVGTCTFRNPEKPSEGWYGAPLDQYQKVWRSTYDNRIGSFYWNWTTGGDALTTNGKCGNWTTPGKFICGSGPYSMPKVSKKTHWMVSGSCKENGTWTSSDPSVALVDDQGWVTGRSIGRTTISHDGETTVVDVY